MKPIYGTVITQHGWTVYLLEEGRIRTIIVPKPRVRTITAVFTQLGVHKNVKIRRTFSTIDRFMEDVGMAAESYLDRRKTRHTGIYVSVQEQSFDHGRIELDNGYGHGFYTIA